jgi:hypothetical protein
MSCICGVLQGAAAAGYSQVRATEDDSPTSGGATLGISSDEDGDSSSTDLLHARISALEEMWDCARSEVDALRTELDESQDARAELEARAAAAVRPRRLPLSEAELKQMALERLARQRGLSMDELRAFKSAATPAELELLRSDLRVCVADLQKEEASAATAPSSESCEPMSDGRADAAALKVELEQVKETLQVECARRESAERNAATTKEMLQNASSRMKVITAEKQTITRQLKAQQVQQQSLLPCSVELNSSNAVAAAEHLSDLQLRLTQAEREHRAQRQSLQDRCATQSAQLQQLSDQLGAQSSDAEMQRARCKQETDRLRASLLAAEHGHSVALAALRKESDEKRAAALDVEVAAAEKRGEARGAVELLQRLEREEQAVAEHAGRAEATEVEAARLRTEMRVAEEALASAELLAEQQTRLAEIANAELVEAREATAAAILKEEHSSEIEQSRQAAVDAAAADLREALDGRRSAEERAIAVQESMAVQGAEAASKATALASAMEDAQRYRSR